MKIIDDLINKFRFGFKSDENIDSHAILFRNLDSHSDNISISEKIEMIRKVHKLSTKVMAAIMGVSYRTYKYYEDGSVEPNAKSIARLSSFTGVSAAWILGISKSVYDEETILALEEDYIHLDSDSHPVFAILAEGYYVTLFPLITGYLDERYSEIKNRRAVYTLQKRANIIFLLNMFIIDCVEKELFYIDLDGKIRLSMWDAFAVSNKIFISLKNLVYIHDSPPQIDKIVENSEVLFDMEAELRKIEQDR